VDGGQRGWFGRAPLGERLRRAHVREDLVEAAERTAFGRQSDREVAALPSLLGDDEVVLQLLEGRHRKMTGLLVLTTGRIVFAAKAKYEQRPLVIARSDVLSASGRTHRGLSALTLATPTGEVVVDQILGSQAETFAANVQRPPEARTPPTDPLAELAELRAMHQAGVIGDAEFRARKSQLFDQI
jgi:Short C-terminal domain